MRAYKMTRKDLIEIAIDYYINQSQRIVDTFYQQDKQGSVIFDIDETKIFTDAEKIYISSQVAKHWRNLMKQGFKYQIKPAKRYRNLTSIFGGRKK